MTGLLHKRLKGFTLVELLVVMLLSSLVLGFAYTSLAYLQKLFKGYKAQTAFVSTVANYRERLIRDFLYADLVFELEPGHFRIQIDSLVKDLKVHEKGMVYSLNGVCDSLFTEATKTEVYYKGIGRDTGSEKLLSRLNIRFTYQGEDFTLCLNKDYSSETLLKWLKNKEHAES